MSAPPVTGKNPVIPNPGDAYADMFAASPMTTKVVAVGNLRRVGERPPLGEYVRLLWARRHFLWADARAKVTSGTRETLLGSAWLVVRPLLDGATYFLVFGVLLGTQAGIENFIGYLLIGTFLFAFTTQCVTGGAKSVANGKNLIRAFTFPRAALPISVVLRNSLNMIPVLVTLGVMIAVIPPAEEVTWLLALVAPVLLLQLLFSTGIALLFARWTAAVPDLNNLIAFGTRLWLYGSGVFFSYERFADNEILSTLMAANPMYMVLDLVRDCVLYATLPDPLTWVWLSLWSVGSLVIGFVAFWRAEETYGR